MAPVQLIIAIGGQQENSAPAAQPASDVLQKLARRWVGPVEILQQEEQPGPFGGQPEEGQDRLVEPHLGLGRFTGVDQRRLQLELRQKLTELTAGGRAELELDPFEVGAGQVVRSEEHTSELQSQSNLVCR